MECLNKLLIVRMIAFLAFSVALDVAQAKNQLSIFGEGEESLEANIVFPKIKNDLSVTIPCQGVVSEHGQFIFNYCFPEKIKRDKPLIRAIHNAIMVAKNSPAMFGDTAVEVIINYRVQFHQDSSAQYIRVYPNNGNEVSDYGDKYYSPQRVLDRTIVKRGMSPNCFTPLDKIYHVNYAIPATGTRPSSIDLVKARRCKTQRMQDAQQWSFILGMKDGQSIAASFKEANFQRPIRESILILWPERDDASPEVPAPQIRRESNTIYTHSV